MRNCAHCSTVLHGSDGTRSVAMADKSLMWVCDACWDDHVRERPQDRDDVLYYSAWILGANVLCFIYSGLSALMR